MRLADSAQNRGWDVRGIRLAPPSVLIPILSMAIYWEGAEEEAVRVDSNPIAPISGELGPVWPYLQLSALLILNGGAVVVEFPPASVGPQRFS
jgi:hypothetical protein